MALVDEASPSAPSSADQATPQRRGSTRFACLHCGAPLTDDRMRASGFCCAGCSYVYRIVHESGLAGYYRIKDEVTAPADATVFQPRDTAWLDEAQRLAEARPSVPELTLDVQGISCAACVWLIERVFQQSPGARDIIVNAQYGSMRLRWVSGEFQAADFARRLQTFGYLAGPAGEANADSEARQLLRRIGLCAAFAMNVMLFSLPVYFGMQATFEWARLFGVLNAGFATLSFLVGGTYFLRRALGALRERAMHIDLPIAIGIVGAYLGSVYGWLAGEERFVYFDFVSTFILLMLVGRWAQVAAVERNRRRLLSRQPQVRRVRLAAGGDAAPADLQPGQVLLLAAGQTLPVESRLAANEAVFSLASINGEAEPRPFLQGQRVPAGAVNIGREDVPLEALQGWPDSLLAKLLEPGQRAPAPHALLDRIVRGYVIGILVVATLAGLGWWWLSGDLSRTWAVVTAVLVVSCPCAIALAFPLADEMATVALRRRGVFVRESDLWPRLGKVRQVVFDKTGTLTLETPVLRNPDAITALAADARAALHTLVRDSAHPVSQALLEQLLATGAAGLIPGEVKETIGAGVEIAAWSLGRAGWRSTTAAAGGTELCHHGAVVARFHFADTARSDAQQELAALGRRGLSVHLLSGDRGDKVATLADQLGIARDQAHGDMTPEAKAAWFERIGHDASLMLGDGANDSLAFDRALCRGTPVIHRGVLEQKADFYYLGRGIDGIRALLETDDVRRRTQTVILAFSIIYNLLAVGLAVAGRMNPLLAAILMPVNSLATLLIVTGGMSRAIRSNSAGG
jgi:Cu2+-exporting ATPase